MRRAPWAAAALFAAAAWAPAQDEGPVKSFAIPDTRYARALFERAQEHLAAGRSGEAIADLQELLDEHRGEVLGGRLVDERGRRSQQPVHPGAAEQARRRLLELGPEARALYVERHGAAARAALERALATTDRRALIEVARRWPIAPAALRAWWALGDLELELGNASAARDAWHRARDLTAALERELTPGARARLELLDSPESPAGAGLAELLSGPGERSEAGAGVALRIPGPGSHSWRQRIDGIDRGDRGTPFTFNRAGDTYNLLPAVAGDAILVSNSMRLWAFDAWSGELRWRSDEAPGWDLVDRGEVRSQDKVLDRDDFFEAVDRGSLLIAPAAAGGIAVAALQIPVTHLGNTRFQNIPITQVIPDRRLFAFDLESGRPLWNHMPPPLWDGETGSFPERMRVAGPPVIAGSRVLVPCYRMQGRVDYHLACYDLFTGGLLWSSALISGQLPLNMFGRHEQEFSAAPVAVAGERVIALTQLGAIAALDLYTGDILWETLYEQVPLPPTQHWQAPRRPLYWSNTPPAVAGDTVLATPIDSPDLIGVDLKSGRLVWSLPHSHLAQNRASVMSLVGAEGDTVWLAGSSVVACTAPEGLATSPPVHVRKSSEVRRASPAPPRAALGARHVVVPTGEARRVALDRFDLAREDRHASATWDLSDEGNVVLRDGALFTLNGRYLNAIFDWEALEQHFARRMDADPGDDRLALDYATFLATRGRTRLADDSQAAKNLFARARAVLEPRLEGEATAAWPEARRQMHRLLRLEAEAALAQADSAAALERLARAREIAPDPGALRDTLLWTAEILRDRREREPRPAERDRERGRWLSALEELERRCGLLDMPEAPFTASDVFGADAARSLFGRPDLRVDLWVSLQRARELAREGEVAAELEELHAILERYGNVRLEPFDAGEALPPRASERIGELARRGGAAYAPFEERARRLLEEALASGEVADLARVIERFPHSAAAREASEARLEAAWRAGDAGMVGRLVQLELPEGWRASEASPREVRILLQLAELHRSRGNGELAAALVRELARHHPDLRAEAGGAERTLAALARELPAEAKAELASERADFDPLQASAALHPKGKRTLLGVLPASTGDGDPSLPRTWIGLAGVRGSAYSVYAFSEARPELPLWSYELGPPGLPAAGPGFVLAPERAVVGTREAVIALDAVSGEPAWTHAFDGEVLESVTGASGVVLATLSAKLGRGRRAVAWDWTWGVELWSRPLDSAGPAPVCGGARAVFLPGGHRPGSAEVLDLFTGRTVVELPLGRAGEADPSGAWIEEGRLVLPSFRPLSTSSAQESGGECIAAWDLDDGERAWRIAAEPGLELDSIVRSGEKTFLVFLGGGGTSRRSAGTVAGTVKELDTRLGAERTVQNLFLREGDVLLGLRRHSVTRLEAPWLFLRSPSSDGRETRLRGIHLPYGERWSHILPVHQAELYNAPMPLPALSRWVVAVAYTETQRRGSAAPPSTTLLFLDRSSGLPRDSRSLDAGLGHCDDLELAAIGDALLVLGRDESLILARQR